MNRRNGNGNHNGNGSSRQQEAPEKKGSPPVFSRRLWTGSATVEVAVFEKVVNEGQQNEFVAYNCSVKRTWKDGDEFKTTQGFRGEDIPHLVSLLNQAHAFITDQMNRE